MQLRSAYQTQQLYARSRSVPKHRVNPKLIHFVNQDNEIVAEHSAQRLDDHGNVRLAGGALYHKRSNVESTYRMMKRKFGDAEVVKWKIKLDMRSWFAITAPCGR
jgi:hypothetical protein